MINIRDITIPSGRCFFINFHHSFHNFYFLFNFYNIKCIENGWISILMKIFIVHPIIVFLDNPTVRWMDTSSESELFIQIIWTSSDRENCWIFCDCDHLHRFSIGATGLIRPNLSPPFDLLEQLCRRYCDLDTYSSKFHHLLLCPWT